MFVCLTSFFAFSNYKFYEESQFNGIAGLLYLVFASSLFCLIIVEAYYESFYVLQMAIIENGDLTIVVKRFMMKDLVLTAQIKDWQHVQLFRSQAIRWRISGRRSATTRMPEGSDMKQFELLIRVMTKFNPEFVGPTNGEVVEKYFKKLVSYFRR